MKKIPTILIEAPDQYHFPVRSWKNILPNNPIKLVMLKVIIDYIKEQITNRIWPVGSRLPSQRDLAKQFGVNRSTIVTALDELAADGLVEGKLGMGTVVINNTWTLMRSAPPVNWMNKWDWAPIRQACRQSRL